MFVQGDPIPLVDLVAQQRQVEDEVRAGLDEVFRTAAFVGGPQVAQFEREYATFSQVAHCVGVANGTDALELALRAAGVTAGGEVVLPANTFIATAEAVSRIGAVPVLVDVDERHLLIDPAAVEAAVTPRTQAIIPVHLFGQVAPVEELEKAVRASGAVVVEDAAQSQGARRHGTAAGSLGTVAATSFYPGKNLGAAGDAGAVTTNDPEIARRVRIIGSHGSAAKYDHEVIGVNSRLDTIQAVVLLAKLRRLAEWNEQRRAAAGRYDALLADVDAVRTPVALDGNEDVWHLYVVRVAAADRARVLAELNGRGIGAGIYYPVPVHLSGAYTHLGLAPGSFPVAEQASGEILSLPMYPTITPAEQEAVVEALAEALRRTSGG